MTAQSNDTLHGLLARLKAAPDAYGLHVALALVHHERGEAGRALESLREATALRPEAMEVHLFAGVLLRAMGRLHESGASLARALELAPGDFDAVVQYGQHLSATGDHEGAVRLLRRALELRPGDPEALNDLGVVLFFSGGLAEAEAVLRRAVLAAPRSVQAQVNLGYTLLARGDAPGAGAALDAALRLTGPAGAAAPGVVALGRALRGEAPVPEAPGAPGTFHAEAPAPALSPALGPALGLSGALGRIDPMCMVKNFGEGTGGEAPSLSVVVPVYNEVGNVPVLLAELTGVLDGLDVRAEIIVVDDGSTDGTGEALEALSAGEPRLRVVQFRRNYGQTAALSAGFKFSRGEIVVTLDGDLQNDPRDIPALLDKMAEGYDLVNGWRKDRKDKALSRRLPSWAANRLINKLIEGTGVQLRDFGCTLKAYKRGIVKNIHIYGEMHRFIPVFAAWLGVRVAEIPVNHRPRVHGSAKYGLSRIWRVIFDLIVVRFFSDYMTRPIQFFGKIARKATGLGLAGIAALWAAKDLGGLSVSYDTLFILLALVLISGLQVVILGLTGELLIRSYFEGQDKDHYVVKRVLGG
jgi:glycosyltransferase involved in cell wall biosynthesis/Flp pilus assembly protein TadD